jgi:hypothetical protein
VEPFVRDGKKLPFPPQPENPKPQAVTLAKWQGGPGMPPVIRANVGPEWLTLMFEDGSGASYLNMSENMSELRLASIRDRRLVGTLQVSFPEPELLTLEGPFDGQDIRMTFRKTATQKKPYVFRSREFRWVQERPFNP